MDTSSALPNTDLGSDQLQQGAVDGQQVDVGADGRLVEGAGLAVEFVQAGLAHGVGAAQADGLVAAAVELIVADGTGQELRPLGRLHWHPAATPLREAPPSSGAAHGNAPRQQLPYTGADDLCEGQRCFLPFCFRIISCRSSGALVKKTQGT